MPISIAIADDHNLFLESLGRLLEGESTVNIIGTATDGIQLLSLLEVVQPDVILMDIGMEVMNGIDATSAVLSKWPNIKVIALTSHNESHIISDMFNAGAKGYLLKNIKITELIEAITSVYNGGYHYCTLTSEAVVGLLLSQKKKISHYIGQLFTKLEIEVIRLICQGKSSKEIGLILHKSPRTIDGYREIIYEKAGVNSSLGLLQFALDNNIFKRPE